MRPRNTKNYHDNLPNLMFEDLLEAPRCYGIKAGNRTRLATHSWSCLGISCAEIPAIPRTPRRHLLQDPQPTPTR